MCRTLIDRLQILPALSEDLFPLLCREQKNRIGYFLCLNLIIFIQQLSSDFLPHGKMRKPSDQFPHPFPYIQIMHAFPQNTRRIRYHAFRVMHKIQEHMRIKGRGQPDHIASAQKHIIFLIEPFQIRKIPAFPGHGKMFSPETFKPVSADSADHARIVLFPEFTADLFQQHTAHRMSGNGLHSPVRLITDHIGSMSFPQQIFSQCRRLQDCTVIVLIIECHDSNSHIAHLPNSHLPFHHSLLSKAYCFYFTANRKNMPVFFIMIRIRRSLPGIQICKKPHP